MVKVLSIDYIKQTEYFLNNYDKVEDGLDNLKIRLREINSKLDECYGEISYDGQPKGNKQQDTIANLLINREYLIDEVMYTQEKINMLHSGIDKLDKDHKAVIEKWYFEDKRANEISDELKISDSTVFRYKKEAIADIAVELHGVNALFDNFRRSKACS